jgi:hypothetical protein
MGFYDQDDLKRAGEAMKEYYDKLKESEAAQKAAYEFRKFAESQNANTGGDWHIDAICAAIGFSDADANVIKSEYDQVFQGLLGGNTSANHPEQYGSPRTSVRQGDPNGLMGLVFSVVRATYFSVENVPVLNSLRFWALVDRLVLRNSSNPTVQNYVQALQQGLSLRSAN